MKYHGDFCNMVTESDVEIVDFGMVDDSEKAYAVSGKMQAANLDLIFCNMITYATSSVFAPIIREVNRPMVLVALQPRAALDYTQANIEKQNLIYPAEATMYDYRLKLENINFFDVVNFNTITFIKGMNELAGKFVRIEYEYSQKLLGQVV